MDSKALICILSSLLVVACSDGGGDGAAGSGGSGATGGDGAAGSGGTSSGSMGSATLTIGEDRWEFDSFGCAFGHDATQSDLFSFSSSAFGEHSDGARVQMQAEIEDPTSQGRYEGDGVVYTIYVADIENFTDPTVDWESTSDEIPGIKPSGQTLVQIDGNRITGEGLFDDRLTENVFEQLEGTLDATCGEQSRKRSD